MDKKDVIKITLELIKEKKLEKASVGEIVKRLDSSPGNLYYHFRSKNEIYEKIVNYSVDEICKSLNKVKERENQQDYLFSLTKALIKFFEEREEILFFLISMKGSCYLEKGMECKDFLKNFKEVLLNKKKEQSCEEMILLKLNMFLGSIYEVLYVSRLINNRNLNEEEIEEIHESFWGEKRNSN